MKKGLSHVTGAEHDVFKVSNSWEQKKYLINSHE